MLAAQLELSAGTLPGSYPCWMPVIRLFLVLAMSKTLVCSLSQTVFVGGTAYARCVAEQNKGFQGTLSVQALIRCTDEVCVTCMWSCVQVLGASVWTSVGVNPNKVYR